MCCRVCADAFEHGRVYLSVPACVGVCWRVPEFGRVFPSVSDTREVCLSVSECGGVFPNVPAYVGVFCVFPSVWMRWSMAECI